MSEVPNEKDFEIDMGEFCAELEKLLDMATARAEAAEAKYKRLVERLKKEIAETSDWTDDGDNGDFFLAVRVSKIEAAINESEVEG